MKELLKEAEAKFYSDKFKANQGNSRNTWSLIGKILNKCKCKESAKIIIGKQEATPELINNYFIESICKIKESIPECNTNESHLRFLGDEVNFSMLLLPTSEEEVRKICKTIKSNSSGCDEIPPNVLRDSLDAVIKPLTYLINLSLKCGKFPTLLKEAKVVPIHKSGDQKDVKNKRQVSILNAIAMIFEKILHIKFSNYFEVNGLINNKQHGFRKGFSTESAIANVLKNVYENINHKKVTAAIFFDYSKAFDCVEHNILLSKLKHLGVRGKAYSLIESYLKDRKQRVFYNGNYSEPISIKYGVPQGSVLGPLLFAIYLNDVLNVCKNLDLSLFADDKAGVISDQCTATVIRALNAELKLLYDWVLANRLSLNMDKTVFMIFSHLPSYNLNPPVVIGTSYIKQVYHTKYLGVTIDYQLKWNEHINLLSRKLSKICAILYRIRQKLTDDALKLLYYGLVYSKMIYGIVFWGGTWNTHLETIILSQKRIIRCMSYARKFDSTATLFQKFNILRFKYVHVYFCRLMGQKVVYGNYLQNVFNVINHGQNTRGAGVNIVLPNVHATVVQKGFLFQIASLWNSQLITEKQISNLETFKRKTKYLLHLEQDI